MTDLHYAGADFILDAGDLDPVILADLLDCGSPGPADEAVAYVRRTHNVTGDPETCAAYLKGYGAWDDDELADHEANLDRLVWLTGCGLTEGETVYFSTYG